MKLSAQNFGAYLCMVFLLATTAESHAFALLGPVQPWMQTSNGVIFVGDIGGPMCISNEYRLNVPVVTYGFDQSFLDSFGTNGVAAVEGAIQILNNLPPASEMVLTNYPFNSQLQNNVAGAQYLFDLKSLTLSILLEHMGLAQPTRNVYVLHDWDPDFFTGPSQSIGIVGMPIFFESDPYGVDPGSVNGSPGYVTNFVAGFNFDPESIDQSIYINSTEYGGIVYFDKVRQQNVIDPYAVDFMAKAYNAVADYILLPGGFYTGLTYDDVGGFRYLLSTNNVNYETLLPGVCGIGSNTNSFVNGAWRPGVDKITFVRHPVDSQSGTFVPMTNCYTDRYITNGVLQHQQLARIIAQPNFLFRAGDVTYGTWPGFWARTGTTNWLNNALSNGNTNGAGPGVIVPPVQIVFNGIGRLLNSNGATPSGPVDDVSSFLGSFDSSTNAPVIYPIPRAGTNQMTVRMWLTFAGNVQQSFVWKPSGLAGGLFAMQGSTNLINWTTLFTVTNNGSVCTYLNENPAGASGFYRLVPL